MIALPTRRFLLGASVASLGALAATHAKAMVLPLGAGGQLSDWANYGVFNVKSPAYGAVGDGKLNGTGNISSSSPNLSVTGSSFVPGDVGKVISVGGAGASGAPLVTTILTYTSATAVVLAANAGTTVSGTAIVHWGTDDTAAIQNTITAAVNAGGGIVFFPNGIYIVNGALQNTSTHNAQLIIPKVSNTTGKPISISLVGTNYPMGFGNQANQNINGSGSIIFSPRIGAGTLPAIFAAWQYNLADDFSYVNVAFANLTFRTAYLHTTPLSCVNMQSAMGCHVENVVLDVAATSAQVAATQPVSGSTAFAGPASDNGAYNRVIGSFALGYDTGFSWGEHAEYLDVQAFGCRLGHDIECCYHPMYGDRIGAYGCLQAIGCSGTTINGATKAPVRITTLAIEHNASGWSTGAGHADVVDGGNKMYGNLTYNVILGGAGYDATFTKTGGTNLACTALF